MKNHIIAIKNILEELKTHPAKYFQKEEVLALEQIFVYHGLYGWNSYRYKVRFPDTVTYIWIKVQKSVGNDTDPAKQLKIQQTVKVSYTNLQFLYEKFKAFPGYSVIKPIACFPEWFAWVTEESSGTDIWTLIRKKAKFYPSETDLHSLENYCYKCGRWLALFQQITRRPDLDPFEFDAVLELLDDYLSRLVSRQNVTFSEELRRKIITYCQQLILLIPEEDRIVAGNHRDFAPGNILFHDDEIIVLDVEPEEYGTIYRDATYFFHYLIRLQEIPIYRAITITKLQQAFVQGFGTSLDPLKSVVTLYGIQNTLQTLLHLAIDREHVSWYHRVYDKILFKKQVHWLQKICQF